MATHVTTAADLLRELRERGIHVRVDAPDLLIRGRIDEELARRIREAKPDLVRYLQGGLTSYPCDTCGRFAFQTSSTCYWCRTTRMATA